YSSCRTDGLQYVSQSRSRCFASAISRSELGPGTGMMCGFCAPWRQVLTHDTEVRPPTQLKVRTPSACAGASAPGAASVATTARPASAAVDLAYNIAVPPSRDLSPAPTAVSER